MGAALVLLLVGLGALAAGVLIGRYYVPDDRQLRRTARHSRSYMRALSHLIARDHETVVSELRAVVEENIEDAEPYFALGAMFRSRGEHERAIRVHQALAMRERDKKKLRVRAMYELGLDFRAAGMPRRATRAMEEVLIDEASHEGAARVLASLYEEQARFNEAAGLWQRIGKRKGEDTSWREHHLLVAAAQAAIGRQDLESARELLKTAQKHDVSAHFFAAAAELAAARGNHRGARERIKQALVADAGLAPHLLPALIAAEQGLAAHAAGEGGAKHGKHDDLDDDAADVGAEHASAGHASAGHASASHAGASHDKLIATVTPAAAGASSSQLPVAASASQLPAAGVSASQLPAAASAPQLPAATAPTSPSAPQVPAPASLAPKALETLSVAPSLDASARQTSTLAALASLSQLPGTPSAPETALVATPDRALIPAPAAEASPPALATTDADRRVTLIPLTDAHGAPSREILERVLAVFAELEAQHGPRLELALLRAQLVPPADAAAQQQLANDLSRRFPDAIAARVAAARLASAVGDPAAIRAALDGLVAEHGSLAWALAGRWQCGHCGHRPAAFSWRCGQCRRWGTLRMETGIEPPPIPPRERRAAPRVARPDNLLGASPDLPAPTLDAGLTEAELASVGTRRSLLGRVGGWVSGVWRRDVT